MAVSRTFLTGLILVVAQTYRPVRPLPAAEVRPGAAEDAFADPQKMLDFVFGQEPEEDKKALARIEVSPREERQMGEAAVGAYLARLQRQKIRVVTRGKDVEYLRALVERIRRSMENGKRYPHINVYLALSPRCDARSFPGGSLVFFRGLLEAAGSEAAVVGIVGHELSHLDRGHQLGRVRRMKLAQQTLSRRPKEFSPEHFFRSGRMMMRIWSQPFRPEDEAEADRDGARWAYLAGYDPREMAGLLLGLRNRGENRPGFLPGFLKTHPAPADRHRAIIALYNKLRQEKPVEKLYIGKENLRRRVTRAQQEFRD